MSRLQFRSGSLVELYPFSKGKGIKEKEVRKREKQVGEKGRGMREREKLYYVLSCTGQLLRLSGFSRPYGL